MVIHQTIEQTFKSCHEWEEDMVTDKINIPIGWETITEWDERCHCK